MARPGAVRPALISVLLEARLTDYLAFRHYFWQAVERADAEQIELAISNPCFEYWFLLHFRESGAFFHNGHELLQELRQHIPAYAKNTDIFDQLYPLTDTALERAERQYTRHPEREQDRYPNPATTVYKLLNSLRTPK